MNAGLCELRLPIDGIDTPLLTGGDGHSSEAVLFVHGNPGSGRDWEALAAGAAEFMRVLAPDLPGYGRAAKPDAFPCTVESYAAHLDALLRAQQVQRVHLVLHDLGGAWGLAWAALHPHQLASLTLINTGVLLDYRWHIAARIWQTPLLGELFQLLATRGAFHRSLQLRGARPLPRAFIDRMYDDYDAATRRAVLRTYRSMRQPQEQIEPWLPALRALQVPTQVIWGARDPYIPANYAQRQREIFAQAQVTLLEDSGHWPFADHPERVAQLLLPFLRSVRSVR
ncbi:MAG TPA: alpha/beta fold hydrolase [Nevskiaceae bacterium]|nr:alpha/beta fold hydrolase [Nevskiaceae bacterium]